MAQRWACGRCGLAQRWRRLGLLRQANGGEKLARVSRIDGSAVVVGWRNGGSAVVVGWPNGGSAVVVGWPNDGSAVVVGWTTVVLRWVWISPKVVLRWLWLGWLRRANGGDKVAKRIFNYFHSW